MFHSLIALKALFASNQFLLGGAILGSLAGILAYAKAIPAVIFTWLKQRVFVTVQIDSSNTCYDWIADWLAEYDHRKFRFVKPQVTWEEEKGRLQRRLVPKIAFTPAPGNYMVKYKGRRVWVGIFKEDEKMGDVLLGERKEIYLTKFGRDKTLINEFLRESYDVRHAYKPDRKVSIYHFVGGAWYNIDQKLPRKRETLIYDDGLLDRIIGDAKAFLDRREWYNALGVPYRRGYLLYGPPGNGKTSLALLLASELDTDICALNLPSLKSDKELFEAMGNMPKGALLLLEDVDAAYEKREKGEDGTGITFSGLLNSLDGIMSVEGRMLVMTTNHKEKLDPALIRSGRVDVHEYVGNANRSQVKRMFQRFFQTATEQQAEAFANLVPPDSLGMSVLQEYFLGQTGPDQAIANTAFWSVLPSKPTEPPIEASKPLKEPPVIKEEASEAPPEDKDDADGEETTHCIETSPHPAIAKMSEPEMVA